MALETKPLAASLHGDLGRFADAVSQVKTGRAGGILDPAAPEAGRKGFGGSYDRREQHRGRR